MRAGNGARTSIACERWRWLRLWCAATAQKPEHLSASLVGRVKLLLLKAESRPLQTKHAIGVSLRALRFSLAECQHGVATFGGIRKLLRAILLKCLLFRLALCKQGVAVTLVPDCVETLRNRREVKPRIGLRHNLGKEGWCH